MANFSRWTWSEKQHQRWAEVRQKGRGRYVLENGVLGWGAPMFVVMAGGPAWFGLPYHADSSPWYWTSSAMLWGGAGLLVGFWTWQTSEKQFQTHEPPSN